MSSMPTPQAQTPTDVASTDVDTGIRPGIEAHSVRTVVEAVKSPKGESGSPGLEDRAPSD